MVSADVVVVGGSVAGSVTARELARRGMKVALVEKARFFFNKMLGYANHLGLYAEELGPAGQHLGNYPQAFTHLGLISAAYNLDRMLR